MVNSRRSKMTAKRQKSGSKSRQKGGKNRPVKNEAFPFWMKNLRSFSMEKLCFDLKLEVLEQMDTNDVIELFKVNKGFQGMLLKNPYIIFGHDVHEMNFGLDGYSRDLTIKKFSTSIGFRYDTEHFGHIQSVKRIDSCKKLVLQGRHETFLRQLKWVDELEFRGGKDDLKKFFADFHAAVKSSAKLFLWGSEFEGEELMKEQLGDLIKTQLIECEKVSLCLNSHDLFHVCYDALSKTRIKLVQISRNSNSLWIGSSPMDFQLNVEWIVKSGIPSQNPHAGFSAHCSVFKIPAEIVAFLKGYPGMQLIEGDDRLPLFEQAKKLWGEDFDSEAVFSSPDWFFPRKHYLCFRRRIDLTKDGVYMLRCPDNPFYSSLFNALQLFSGCASNGGANNGVFDCVNFYAFYVPA